LICPLLSRSPTIRPEKSTLPVPPTRSNGWLGWAVHIPIRVMVYGPSGVGGFTKAIPLVSGRMAAVHHGGSVGGTQGGRTSAVNAQGGSTLVLIEVVVLTVTQVESSSKARSRVGGLQLSPRTQEITPMLSRCWAGHSFGSTLDHQKSS